MNLTLLAADNIFTYPFMQRAIIAAIMVALAAPSVGIYLVQRRLSLLGDGIGHIAFAGVGLGFLLGTSPIITAIIVSIVGAVVVELVRTKAATSGDLALALLFYGGIATGVLLISLKSGSATGMQAVLFGQIFTVDQTDLWIIAALALCVLAVTVGLRKALFTASHDEDFAQVSGLPVPLLNILVAATAAITVSVSMRVVGVLLISALMVIPVAAASQLARSFTATLFGAITIAVIVALAGVILSFPLDVSAGPLIVVLAIGVFCVCALAGKVVRR